MSFRCIKAFMHAFSGRFSRTCLEGISFKFFVCFIFNVSLGSAPKRKNFDIQRNTRVASGGQFTSNRLSNDHKELLFQNFLISDLLRPDWTIWKRDLLQKLLVFWTTSTRWVDRRLWLFDVSLLRITRSLKDNRPKSDLYTAKSHWLVHCQVALIRSIYIYFPKLYNMYNFRAQCY